MATNKPKSSSSSSGVLGQLLSIVLPTRANKKGLAIPGHYNPSDPQQVLTVPDYRNHLTDLFTSRASSNSRELIKNLFIHDPDTSAAVNSYLTMANTEMMAIVKDVDGAIDREGQKILNAVLMAFEQRSDYSKGFQLRPSMREICENLRWLLLRSGTLPVEMVMDENFSITEFRIVTRTRWNGSNPNLASSSLSKRPAMARPSCSTFPPSSSSSIGATRRRCTRTRPSCRPSTPSRRANKSSMTCTASCS